MDCNNYLRENYKSKPLIELVKDLNCEYADLALCLRKEGLLDDINIYDVNYVLNNINNTSLNELGRNLGLTKNQIANIVNKFSKAKRVKHVGEYTEEEVKNKFKFIIENKICKPINDTLAYEININRIKKYEGGYALLKWATIKKENHPIYKYFSAIAYLFHVTYPNKFRPYQFNHTKETKKYFNKKKYLGELVYIIENKLLINRENISALSKVNGFLNNKQLDFYGLSNLHLKLFGNKSNMINNLLEHVNQQKEIRYEPLYILKEKLEAKGIKTNKCFCDNCKNTDIEIHHIYNKQYSFNVNFNVDDEFNLIPLCKKHHYMVKTMDIDILDTTKKNDWRKFVKNYISNKEKDT